MHVQSGKSAIVFDCVFSSSLKSRCAKDKDFKLYLIGKLIHAYLIYFTHDRVCLASLLGMGLLVALAVMHCPLKTSIHLDVSPFYL